MDGDIRKSTGVPGIEEVLDCLVLVREEMLRKQVYYQMLSQFLSQFSAKKGVKLSNLKAGNEYFGTRGFNSVHKKASNTMSLSYIENNYDKMVSSKMIENDVFDSTKYKIDKILGRGKFTRKLKVICNDISKSAKSQIEAVGGKVEVLGESEESSNSEE